MSDGTIQEPMYYGDDNEPRHHLLGVVLPPEYDFLPEYDDTVAQVTKSREAIQERIGQLVDARTAINREIKQRRSQDNILRRMERAARSTT